VGMQIECYLHQTGHSRSLGLRIQRPWHLRRIRVHGRLRRARLVRRRRQRRAVDEGRLAQRRAVVCVARPLASAPAQNEQKRERGQREPDHATERDARDRSATDGMPGAEAGQKTAGAVRRRAGSRGGRRGAPRAHDGVIDVEEHAQFCARYYECMRAIWQAGGHVLRPLSVCARMRRVARTSSVCGRKTGADAFSTSAGAPSSATLSRPWLYELAP
jgi:hypothetical protein